MTDVKDSSLCQSSGILTFYLVFTVFVVIGHTRYLLFVPLNSVEWLAAGASLLLSLLIFWVLRLLELLMEHLHTKYEIGELRRYKNNLFIGFGGMAVCGWIPRITVHFIETNIPAIWCCVLVSVATLFIFYAKFIGFTNRWEFHIGEREEIISGLIAVAHFISLVIIVRIVVTCYTVDNGQAGIVLCHMGFSLICGTSMNDLCILLMGAMKLKKRGDQNRRRDQITGNWNTQSAINVQNSETGALETARVVEVAKTVFVYPRIECNICMMEYNETSRTPRNLKECGHTVCQDCADRLLKQYNGSVIFCPFCQKATVVNGPANFLPKNYVALGLIQDWKKN